MGGIIQALLISRKSRADVTPIGALSKVYDKINVPVLPQVRHMTIFFLGFKRFDLEPVGLWAIGCDEVNCMCRIKQRRKNLPSAVHQPSGNEQLVRVILVQPGVGLCHSSRSLGHTCGLSEA